MADSRKVAHLRDFLIRKQNGRCYYCQRRMGPAGSGQLREATIDEIIPRSAGGKRNRTNCVAACLVCNGAKADVPAADFIAALRQFEQETANG